jgi:Coenzyme PQQ synthesis protein D (PqqD)
VAVSQDPFATMSPGDPQRDADAGFPLRLAEESLTWREVDDEIVVLDRRNWMYMGVNGSGVLLWKEIVNGASRQRLVQSLCEEYEIDVETAERDARAFIEMLSSNNLLISDGVR